MRKRWYWLGVPALLGAALLSLVVFVQMNEAPLQEPINAPLAGVPSAPPRGTHTQNPGRPPP